MPRLCLSDQPFSSRTVAAEWFFNYYDSRMAQEALLFEGHASCCTYVRTTGGVEEALPPLMAEREKTERNETRRRNMNTWGGRGAPM
ncbi:hypothetical protein L249_3933 [Ophiocordyceps polyrhachis-furcata BCC 54312]|uniref:Uncharacterized protein n=1 Tax=Ophiocordyceps polyrhachis-furcata BCC 54312 TaxID=1330021 RepID=A0A367L5S3_9HYPO|nr:hypothetical protein L249_3933 [Ophiocordyceps polyrhachis-furcata BCC 54312]